MTLSLTRNGVSKRVLFAYFVIDAFVFWMFAMASMVILFIVEMKESADGFFVIVVSIGIVLGWCP